MPIFVLYVHSNVNSYLVTIFNVDGTNMNRIVYVPQNVSMVKPNIFFFKVQLAQHINGKSHQKNTSHKKSCHLCGIKCNSFKQYAQHMTSKYHKPKKETTSNNEMGDY